MSQQNISTKHRWKGYPKYKDSDVEWLGDVPEGWEITPLNNLFLQIKVINHPDKTLLSVFRDQGVVPYKFGEDNRNRPSLDLSAYQLVKKGDLVINKMKCWQGSLSISNYEGIVSPAYIVCRSKKKFEKRFIHHLLRSSQYIEQYQRFSFGVRCNQWDIRFNDFKLIKGLLPPLDEQKKILDFLDHESACINTLIAKKEQQIDLLKEKRAALISHAVTKGLDTNVNVKDSGFEWIGKIPEHWKISKIKWISLKMGSGKTPRGGAETYIDSGILFIRSQNVQFEGLKLDDVVFIDSQMDEEMKSTRVKENDVLLNITGASLGRCAWVSIKIDANVSQHVCIIRPRIGKINPQFLNNFLSSSVAQMQIELSQDGVSREGLPLSGVGNIIILSPFLPEQQKIALYIEEKTALIDAVIEKILHSINLLEKYRNALISAAVTGKIDVREAV